MERRVLTVLPNLEQLERVTGVLKKELVDIKFDFTITSTEATAKEKLRSGEKYDLVITCLGIPKDTKALAQEASWRASWGGLDLATWMEDENLNTPTILFTVAEHTELSSTVDKLRKCELVNERIGWEELFIKRVKQGLEGREVTEEKRLDIDIRLNLDVNLAEASYKGVGFPCNLDPTPLNVDVAELLQLTPRSRDVDKLPEGKWERELHYIGEALMNHIFQRNFRFFTGLWTEVTKAGGLNNTRIRFIVEKEVHPIALEAIYGPYEHQEEDYWMLHAPIYRTVGKYKGKRYPLFHDRETREGPLNILIIESPVEGEVEIKDKETKSVVRRLTLKKVENVKAECQFLKNYRDSAEYTPGRVKIGKVEVIPIPGDSRPFIKQVQETLEQKTRVWHIVHYAGHSYFDTYNEEGYVFFPGGKDEKGEPVVEKVNLELLSVWLRSAETRLVFLSSCHSSDVGFVFALASKENPAIVGFRWDVEDDMAAEYTRAFYRELFGGQIKSLENIFLKTRQYIHDQYKNNPIWAASVLVMQIPPPQIDREIG